MIDLNVLSRHKTNKHIEGYKRNKGIVGVQGRLFVECEVFSKYNKKHNFSVERGESSGNMKNFDYYYLKAIQNAQKKHEFKFKVSGSVVRNVLDYYIIYFNDDVEIKRKLVKPKKKVVIVPSYKKVVSKKEVTNKIINVKSYFRKGKKVKGYTRILKKEVTSFTEVIVKGYEYEKKSKDKSKGKYESVVYFKGEEVHSEKFRFIKTKSLNKELIMINKAQAKVRKIDGL